MALCVSAKPACGLLYHKVDLVPCGNPEMKAQGQSGYPSYGEGRARGCLVSVLRCEAPARVGFPTCPRWWEWGRESHQGHQWICPGFSRGIALSPPWPQTMSLTYHSSACSWRDCGIGEAARAWLECKPCLCLGDFQQAAFP